jgi:serine/threonine-protein kinase
VVDDNRTLVANEAAPTGVGSASPVEAMRRDELERSRVFVKVALVITLSGIVVALSTSGDAVARAVVLAGSTISGAACVWLLAMMRDAATYHPRKLLVPALGLVLGAMSGVYYWGTASPITGLCVFGIYFFGLSSDLRSTAIIYAAIAGLHGVLGFGILLELLEDRGMIKMTGLVGRDQLGIVIIVECLYLFAFVTARISQRVTMQNVQRLEQAVRSVAQKEALLVEARAELDRALKIGGPGRFTDQQVGSFRIGVLIGRGGMGEVYEATHVDTKQPAAMKLLYPTTLADPLLVKRFLREAQIVARIDSRNVVRVLEVGKTSGELPYLAMERLRGRDLAYELRAHRRLSLPVARTLVEDVAHGLEAARAQAIVHRDLKPNNVFGDGDGKAVCWKILDFGVSKVGVSGTLTKGEIVGTPAFMAPEQAKGGEVDHRADVYSLAAILYRAVTGRPAFSSKDIPTTLYEVVFLIPMQPSMFAPLPADVDRTLAIGLAKSPSDRFQNAAELAAWFARAIESDLDPAQRRRADELIARAPWGSYLRDATGG